MTVNEYEKLAMRTGQTDRRGSEKLLNACLGLAGESGEVCDIVKKYMYQCHNVDVDDLVNELGDVLWYIVLACDTIGISLEDVMKKNIEKLERRYPNNVFEAKCSIERKE